MNRRDLILHLRSRYLLDWRGLHGIAHWSRVRASGRLLAKSTGADREVVELFAWLHDACRCNDDHDPEHGPRAARLAEELRDVYFELDDERFGWLVEALHGHTEGRLSPNPTVQTCWDADRLDLGRASIMPDPRRLGTEVARDPRTVAAAYRRSRRWVEYRRQWKRRRA